MPVRIAIQKHSTRMRHKKGENKKEDYSCINKNELLVRSFLRQIGSIEASSEGRDLCRLREQS